MAKRTSELKIALVGAETLLGRELQEVVETRNPEFSIETYAANAEGNFGEQEGETVYVEPLTSQAVESTAAILLAGSPAGAEKTYQLARDAGAHPVVVDCTGLLESHPEARIVAPVVASFPHDRRSWLLVAAHPAAIALTLVMTRLARYRRLKCLVVNIFEPASERGRSGVSELHQQTTTLLAFKTLNKDVFDAQASFNLLPQYGKDAPAHLFTVEQRIERNLATLISRQTDYVNLPMPSLRLLQAPVFHGYSLSIWTEFETDIDAQELGENLATAQIEVRNQDEEAPTNVGVASQSGLIAGDIRVDRNNPRAAWIWVVLDNLRMMSDTAADILRITKVDGSE